MVTISLRTEVLKIRLVTWWTPKHVPFSSNHVLFPVLLPFPIPVLLPCVLP